ncbi:hypothetical protein ABW16_01200 [Mycolicibacter heraklionensis]|uniref:DUF2752 domain-containing protein n=1 Tax=Mycolicibacter heraklionensis TaxID=512402 RepID=A0ABR5FKH8_9MYCO|nr:hypothetical protein [Mycolicibacter heraklionensis]KLO31496.1 hypothetical protein ABW16_01200 [Mycolicibacter heraklionensis]
MSTHNCPRCGYQQHYRLARWTDRHPGAAVALAVVGLISVTAYPWLLAVLAAAGLAYGIDRERQRRTAVAARADYEHAALLAAPAPPVWQVRRLPQVPNSAARTMPQRAVGK